MESSAMVIFNVSHHLAQDITNNQRWLNEWTNGWMKEVLAMSELQCGQSVHHWPLPVEGGESSGRAPSPSG